MNKIKHKELQQEFEKETNLQWWINPVCHGEIGFASWEYQTWLERKIISNRVQPEVSRDFCGHCEDCKYWQMVNLECKNDIVWLNKPDNIFLNISDLKTNLKFGCIRFESKNSG